MPPEPLILGFDTSAAHCAAALLSGDRLLSHTVEPMAKGQAERLMPLLEETLSNAGAKWQDLSAIGVGIGPGNFTGIRISVSAARGLSLGLGIPAVGVSTLEAFALGAERPVISLIDARRDTLYMQRFDQAVSGEVVQATFDEVVAHNNNEVTFVGHRIDDVARATSAQTAAAKFPMAEAIARLAQARYENTASRPIPLYVRAADAAPPPGQPVIILP